MISAASFIPLHTAVCLLPGCLSNPVFSAQKQFGFQYRWHFLQGNPLQETARTEHPGSFPALGHTGQKVIANKITKKKKLHLKMESIIRNTLFNLQFKTPDQIARRILSDRLRYDYFYSVSSFFPFEGTIMPHQKYRFGRNRNE